MQTATEHDQLKVALAVVYNEHPGLSREEAADLAIRGDWVKGGTVDAYVNHNRWVADCPCGGAELVNDQPMLCGSCGVEHTVSYPAERRSIETLLNHRLEPNTRNWKGETVDTLKAENIRHGESI